MKSYYKSKYGELHHGDCLEVLKAMKADSVETLVSDFPAGISFMGKKWDSDKGGRENWIPWIADVMREALRVCKPGAMGYVWALPRTAHWTGEALERSGWIIRGKLYNMFGSGFPKSANISKMIDKQAGAERETRNEPRRGGGVNKGQLHDGGFQQENGISVMSTPATPEAKLWDGYGTALAPAVEERFAIMAPLDGTFANNALAHGVAGLNIDGWRVPRVGESGWAGSPSTGYGGGFDTETEPRKHNKGGWPKSAIIDRYMAGYIDGQASQMSATINRDGVWTGEGSEGVSDYFFQQGVYYGTKAGADKHDGLEDFESDTVNDGRDKPIDNAYQRGKTKKRNTHPSVKDINLMRYLCRLTATPTGGTIIDPFAGSGSTLIAAYLEGRKFIGIEEDEHSCKIAAARIKDAMKQGNLFF